MRFRQTKIFALGCLFATASCAEAANPSPNPIKDISTLVSVLSNAQLHTPFDITGTVTYCESFGGGRIAIQDREKAICCWNYTNPTVLPSHGDIVRLTGLTGVSKKRVKSPCADCYGMTILGLGHPVAPKRISADKLASNDYENALVSLSGTITDALHDQIDAKWSFFMANCDGVVICAAMHYPELTSAKRNAYIGASVTLTGICKKHTGLRWAAKNILYLDSPDAITVLSPPPSDPFSAEPVTQLNFLGAKQVPNQVRRLASGTVITTWGRNKVLLKTDVAGLIKVELASDELPVRGKRILVSGYPETDLYNVILVHAIWKSDSSLPPHPEEAVQTISARTLIEDDQGRPRYCFDLHGHTVQIRGIVRGKPSEGNPDRCLYLDCDNCTVVVDAENSIRKISDLSIGTTISVTGICVMETDKINLNYLFPRINGFRIVPRSPADIQIISSPSWWTTRRLLVIIGVLSLVIVAFWVWNRILKSLVDRKSRELFNSQIGQAESELRIDERTRLAAELHDYIAQNLTAVSYQLTAAESAQKIKSSEATAFLANAMRMLQSCRVELRRCLWDLRNNALDDPDFGNAIRQTISPVTHGATVAVRFQVPRSHMSDRTAHAVLSILRELVANAVRHGNARQIRIAGDLTDGALRFSVSDNGTGFDTARRQDQSEGHFGLSGIVERVERLGGTFQIVSTLGKGAKAVVTIHVGNGDRTNRADT